MFERKQILRQVAGAGSRVAAAESMMGKRRSGINLSEMLKPSKSNPQYSKFRRILNAECMQRVTAEDVDWLVGAPAEGR